MDQVFTPEYLNAMAVHKSMMRKHGLVYSHWLQMSMTAAGFVDVAGFVRYTPNDVSCSSTADICMQVSMRLPAESSESGASVQAERLPDDPWAGLV